MTRASPSARAPSLRRAREHARGAPHRLVVALALALAACVASATSCGGEGVAAPHVIGAREDTGCPSADAALANTRAALGIDDPDSQADELRDLRPILREILVEDGGLRVLVQGAAVLLEDPSEITLRRFLGGIDPEAGLGKLTPHTVEVLRYIDGTSPHVDGAHLGPLSAVHEILATCDAAETVTTLRALLELEVTRGLDGKPALARPGAGDGSYLSAMLDAARVAVAEPALVEVIESIQLDENASGDGSIHVGRDAWAVLLRLVGENLAAPDFDPAYTRQIVEDVILVRIAEADARDKARALVDLLLLLTEPDADIFPQMQSIMQCIHDTDDEAFLPDMLYDWLTIEALSYDALLADLGSATDGDAASGLRLAAIDLLRAFEGRPQVARDVSAIAARLVDPRGPSDEPGAAGPGALIVKAMLRLQGRGVVVELARITDALDECDP